MAEIKTIYKGESISLLFTFPVAYDMARLTSQKVFVGETEFAGVKDGQTVKLQLKSSDTDRMIGTHRVVLWLDDTTLGLRKPYCGDLVVAKTQAAGNTVSVSNISDIIIPIVISETAITVGDILYNYVIGRSAYQVWLDLGNVGTEQDFIDSLAAGGIDLSAYLTELEAQGLYQPIGAYLTAETDPTVPAWAKAATKPTYTAAEVGAAETDHNHTDLHTHSNKAVLDATTASFTTDDESKLDGLSNYTHPESHPATIIAQDATHRFVTDTEKTTWSGKADTIHNHDDRYYTEGEIDTIKNDLLNLIYAGL